MLHGDVGITTARVTLRGYHKASLTRLAERQETANMHCPGDRLCAAESLGDTSFWFLVPLRHLLLPVLATNISSERARLLRNRTALDDMAVRWRSSRECDRRLGQRCPHQESGIEGSSSHRAFCWTRGFGVEPHPHDFCCGKILPAGAAHLRLLRHRVRSGGLLGRVYGRRRPFYRSGFGREEYHVPNRSHDLFHRFRIHGEEYRQLQHCSYPCCRDDSCLRYLLHAH